MLDLGSNQGVKMQLVRLYIGDYEYFAKFIIKLIHIEVTGSTKVVVIHRL